MKKINRLVSLGVSLGVMVAGLIWIPGALHAQGSYLAMDTFANLAQQTAGAVVNISSETEVPTGIAKSPYRQFLKQFFGPIPKTMKVHSLGSGFIIDPRGYVVTNNHVVDGATSIKVILVGEREFKGTVKGRDPETDLALVQIVDPPENLPILKLGDSDAMRVGDWVLAVGNPFGLSHTVTQGIISAKGRVIGAGPYDKFFQTDALINPGNSGGPLLNLNAEVIGINSMILAKGQGIGFAIPSNIAKAIVPQLQEKGKVIRGMIGVVVERLTPKQAKKLGIPVTPGAPVVKVNPGSPAQKAGIRPGDVIINFNGQAIKHLEQLPLLVEETQPGTEVTVMVLRKGKELKFRLKVAELTYPSRTRP